MPIDALLATLSPAEKDQWLKRLLDGEPQLSLALRRQLASRQPALASQPQVHRSIAELAERAEALRKERAAKARAEAERRHIARIKQIAPQAEKLWAQAVSYIDTRKASNYV